MSPAKQIELMSDYSACPSASVRCWPTMLKWGILVGQQRKCTEVPNNGGPWKKTARGLPRSPLWCLEKWRPDLRVCWIGAHLEAQTRTMKCVPATKALLISSSFIWKKTATTEMSCRPTILRVGGCIRSILIVSTDLYKPYGLNRSELPRVTKLPGECQPRARQDRIRVSFLARWGRPPQSPRLHAEKVEFWPSRAPRKGVCCSKNSGVA